MAISFPYMGIGPDTDHTKLLSRDTQNVTQVVKNEPFPYLTPRQWTRLESAKSLETSFLVHSARIFLSL